MCTFIASCSRACLSWTHTPVINWAVCVGWLLVTLLEVNEKKEGLVALHLPTVRNQRTFYIFRKGVESNFNWCRIKRESLEIFESN